MSLPASGTIGLLAIRAEFSPGGPLNLLNYLNPGACVSALDYAPNVPANPPVSLRNFYSAAKATLVTYTTSFYPTSGSGTGWTNPANGYAADAVYATCSPGSLQMLTAVYGNFRNAGATVDATVAAGATINWVKLHAKGKVASVTSREHDMAAYCAAISALALTTALAVANTEYVTAQTAAARSDLLDGTFAVTVDMSNVSGATSICSLDAVWLEVNYTQ